MVEKKQLRKEFLFKRNQLKSFEIESFSDQISNHLWKYISKNTDINKVLGFVNIHNEPNLETFYNRIFETKNIQLFFPRVNQNRLEFIKFSNWQNFQTGPFGIRQPLGKASTESFNQPQTLILVPSLAIYQNGVRIGYGGGYYDRFLAQQQQADSMAILYNQFCFLDQVYKGEAAHDFRIKKVITEKGLFHH